MDGEGRLALISTLAMPRQAQGSACARPQRMASPHWREAALTLKHHSNMCAVSNSHRLVAGWGHLGGGSDMVLAHELEANAALSMSNRVPRLPLHKFGLGSNLPISTMPEPPKMPPTGYEPMGIGYRADCGVVLQKQNVPV